MGSVLALDARWQGVELLDCHAKAVVLLRDMLAGERTHAQRVNWLG